jgi:hypothetical protein
MALRKHFFGFFKWSSVFVKTKHTKYGWKKRRRGDMILLIGMKMPVLPSSYVVENVRNVGIVCVI